MYKTYIDINIQTIAKRDPIVLILNLNHELGINTETHNLTIYVRVGSHLCLINFFLSI